MRESQIWWGALKQRKKPGARNTLHHWTRESFSPEGPASDVVPPMTPFWTSDSKHHKATFFLNAAGFEVVGYHSSANGEVRAEYFYGGKASLENSTKIAVFNTKMHGKRNISFDDICLSLSFNLPLRRRLMLLHTSRKVGSLLSAVMLVHGLWSLLSHQWVYGSRLSVGWLHYSHRLRTFASERIGVSDDPFATTVIWGVELSLCKFLVDINI